MSQSPPQEDCMIPKSNSLCNRNQFLLPFIHRELKKLAVKIYNAVAQQKGVEPRSFRLQYDGQRLLPNDSTPADLNLENDDALDYYVEQPNYNNIINNDSNSQQDENLARGIPLYGAACKTCSGF
ncbi:hypothetical protein PCANC_02331 [Puccinia coronata f. sp. avenae]|uniref:Ubiquitin-like domain-containing protein n=1 Tax=Puccinia coronata f. sp. avenae TaxID=200324 RepID=A0A2N5VZ81_9BASI|nr:hypothetical protein PCANC_02331 [Puccinia coronata f. sp. avenae]